MTSDGIDDEDWERVQDAALTYVHATADESDDGNAELRAIVHVLDELELKYGRLPSLLATRADYVDDVDSRIALLEEAFELAQARQDYRNVIETADSLATTYIRQLDDSVMGRTWLTALERHLPIAGRESDMERYADLAQSLEELDRRAGQS